MATAEFRNCSGACRISLIWFPLVSDLLQFMKVLTAPETFCLKVIPTHNHSFANAAFYTVLFIQIHALFFTALRRSYTQSA